MKRSKITPNDASSLPRPLEPEHWNPVTNLYRDGEDEDWLLGAGGHSNLPGRTPREAGTKSGNYIRREEQASLSAVTSLDAHVDSRGRDFTP